MPMTSRLRATFRHYKPVLKALSRSRSSIPLTCLMYHSVTSDLKSDFIYPKVKITPKVFEKDIKYVAANYNVIGVDDYYYHISEGTPLPERSLIISFDDGYLDNLEYALPILKAYEMPAILYLATRYIDNSEAQWVDCLFSILKYGKK